MRYISKQQQAQESSREVEELRANIKKQQSITDYIAMMTGVDFEKEDSEDEE